MFWAKKLDSVLNRINPSAIELLILQPTPFCNIDCSYCYLSNRGDRKRLTVETLDWLCRRVFNSPFLGERLSIVWHAGEPLVLPPAYYREVFSIIDKYLPGTLTVNHCIQTNGMLINAEWVELIVERAIGIGISIDGPQPFHDKHRITRSGKGTFGATLDGIRQLQQAGVDFHVITVLTAQSLGAADEFFDFYVANGIKRVCFNVEEIEGPHRQSSLQQAQMVEAYSNFLRRFLYRMKELPPGVLAVREFDATIGLIGTTKLPIWNHQIEPFAILSMDVEGNLSTFSPELLGVANPEFNNFVFGNVHTHSLEEVLKHPALLRTHREIQKGIKRCQTHCAYYSYCGGGAPSNKLFENQSFDSHETLFCRLTKKDLIELVLSELESSFPEPKQ